MLGQSVTSARTSNQPERRNLVHPAYRPPLGDNVRLLILQPGSFGDPIRCQLEQVSLSDRHAYEALSYVWGDVNDTSSMSLDGVQYRITKNLERALRYLRHKDSSRILWIDAVCINQINEDERSEQVSKMGEIYSGATKVNAWLGEADPQVDCIFAVLQEFRDHMREGKFSTHPDAAIQLSFHRELFCDIYHAKTGTLPERTDQDDDMLHPEFNWLRSFYARPYWLRVWIVQELILAKMVVVCYGDKSIDLDDIYGLSPNWGSFEQGFDTGAYQKLKPHTRGWKTIQTIHGHRQRRKLVEWDIREDAPYPISIKMSERGDVAMLDEVIGVYARYHKCERPKDKVYGFRELVSQWRENLVVDYRRSDLEVFLDVAKLGFFEPKNHGGLHVALWLWSAMGLGDEGKFNDCVRQSFPVRISVAKGSVISS